LVLCDKDIVQIDATVIVGILILLTLVSTVNNPFQQLKAFIITFATAWGMFPFTLSAIRTLGGNSNRGYELMRYGFNYLLIVMAVIVVLSGYQLIISIWNYIHSGGSIFNIVNSSSKASGP
jgi:hypothetical protein